MLDELERKSSSQDKLIKRFRAEFSINKIHDGMEFPWEKQKLSSDFSSLTSFSIDIPEPHFFTYKDSQNIFWADLEEKITLESLKSSNNIIAVGGGTFLNDKIRKQITNNSISIWLNWSEQILIPRIKNSKKRPKAYLLKDKDLKKLINDRSKIYSKADYKINCDSLGKNEIISKILKIYEK